MSQSIAEFQHVSKDYTTGLFHKQTIHALGDVSFKIGAGEVFGLLGPNRAGKTTLVKILLGLAQPTSGTVLRLGQPVADRSTLAQVGHVHENQVLPRYWTAAGLLHFYGALTLMDEPLVRQRVPLLLERVGLADRAGEPIARFSKGMVQRLAIAQALLNDPELLVMDEPAEGLDIEGRQLVRDLVNEQRRRGKSVLLVSHVLPEVESLCDRVAVLIRGTLVFLGPLRALLQANDSQPRRPLEEALQPYYSRV
jgi:ABC-2 type transport system ATP-binding protein